MTRDTAVNGSNSGRRMGLAGWIFVGLIAGVICGLFFGEYCARIDFIGKAFIGLMQMTILPYIAVALVTNIGRLDLHDARMYARVGGVFFLISCVAGLAAIVLMPQSFPAIETA